MRTRNSEVNSSYQINEDKWVLTLTRKTTKGSHKQHAFFILEGIENRKAITYFMDLVGPKREFAVLLPNIKDSKIRVESLTANTRKELDENPLLYRCKTKMMDLKPYDELALLPPWLIDKEDAQRLIDVISNDQKNPPVFNIFGESSVFTGSSAKLSSKERGHNCFTYAKEKIEELNVPDIKIECDKTTYYIDKVVGISSFTLKPIAKPATSSGSCLTSRCALFSTLAVVGAGVAIEAARRYYFTP